MKKVLNLKPMWGQGKKNSVLQVVVFARVASLINQLAAERKTLLKSMQVMRPLVICTITLRTVKQMLMR